MVAAPIRPRKAPQRCVAIIPARGGSKRIPRKNIRMFSGKPVLFWTIDALWKSKSVERVLVSTDDPEIAAVAKACGAEVPFLRPKRLAEDRTPTLPVVSHAISALEALGYATDYVCCAYPASPLMQAGDLRGAFKELVRSGAEYVFSCTSFEFPIQRALRKAPDGSLVPMFPRSIRARSQDLEAAFHDAGQFYWGTAKSFLQERPIFSSASRPHFVPSYRVQDIDTMDDWIRAEMLFEMMRKPR